MSREPAPVDLLLDVIESKIIPLTQRGVISGNKLFGAAILRKSDGSIVVAGTNNETQNPLWHGEIHTLKQFFEIPADQRPATSDCWFLSTHEPCSLCLSAITWAGFDNFHYLFSHEDSRDSFAIPHDLNILKEVFRLDPGGYNNDNAYWKCYSIRKLADELPALNRDIAIARIREISKAYNSMSEIYQDTKEENTIPLN